MLIRKMTAFVISPIALALMVGSGALQAKDGGYLSPIEELGKTIFFDESLSINENQACASCHVPEVGFTGAISEFNEAGSVYEGSIPGSFGNRKPPSSAYATLAPRFYADFGNRLMGDNDDELADAPLFVGGNFWDGRATGWELGNPAADQAQGPFTNPVEQALPNTACVVYRVCEGEYGELFDEVWSPGRCMIKWPANIEDLCEQQVWPDVDPVKQRDKVEATYDRIALSIAAFEGSSESNAFTSKIDAHRAGDYDFSKEEIAGRNIFRGKGKCSLCHTGAGGPGAPAPLFTDFTFDNLGVPKNPENPASIANPDWADPGLAGFLENVSGYVDHAPSNLGKSKVPTLRNVSLGSCEAAEEDDKGKGHGKHDDCIVKAYMHNGYFKSLKSVVHFYNTRDVLDSCEDLGFVDATEAVALENNCWPQPEVAENVNVDELGDLELTEDEENALVTWMKAMSDGYYDKRKGHHD
ncbi:MAG: cytochrome c peroxidase [Pseudomonadota bacterium]